MVTVITPFHCYPVKDFSSVNCYYWLLVLHLVKVINLVLLLIVYNRFK